VVLKTFVHNKLTVVDASNSSMVANHCLLNHSIQSLATRLRLGFPIENNDGELLESIATVLVEPSPIDIYALIRSSQYYIMH